MIKPGNNFIIRQILHYYVTWIVKHHFHELKFDPIRVDPGKSILLIANHFSYWDSLILYILCRKLLKKNFHVMVREDTTIKFQYVKYGGAFSINRQSKDVLQSLDYAAELLKNPQNLVLIFPQGKLYSNFVNTMQFEKGITRVIEKAEGKFQLLFAATFVQYLKHKKPTAAVYLQVEPLQDKSFEDLKNAYQIHYDNAKLQQTEIVI
ncbi:lysophospholipid acyltransferase family protein [Mucilaginibacter sp. BT774]|uniref:lysophospholipid acyltransferase family protein n=1 Tax=Mucilaginibacter sp. BT774 TaxID=3062276 RepID=UPI0026745D8F|nr:lysophospholipid acyltransferase family protein [Mucilaginibacter sp. BT774]MDO3625513.1 lysophospholipid acyltransferase family protein [Mucilaginibacter sp. BT774]